MGTHHSWEHLQRSYFTGTTDAIVARIKDLEAAGLQHMVLCPLDYDLEQLEMYASEILPHFHYYQFWQTRVHAETAMTAATQPLPGLRKHTDSRALV